MQRVRCGFWVLFDFWCGPFLQIKSIYFVCILLTTYLNFIFFLFPFWLSWLHSIPVKETFSLHTLNGRPWMFISASHFLASLLIGASLPLRGESDSIRQRPEKWKMGSRHINLRKTRGILAVWCALLLRALSMWIYWVPAHVLSTWKWIFCTPPICIRLAFLYWWSLWKRFVQLRKAITWL